MAEEQEINLDLDSNEKIGDYLRRVREARGLNIEHLAKSIRLGKNILQAIEDNRWNEFPTEAYLRSYISSMCEKLSVDKTAVLKKFSIDSDSHFCVEQNIINEQKDEPKPNSVAKILIIIILLIAAIMFFVNKLFLSGESESYYDEEPPLPKATVETPVEDSINSDTIAVPKSQPIESAPANLQIPKTPRTQDTLRFECDPVPDKSCGAIRVGKENKASWFVKSKELYINHNDTTRVIIYNPYNTRLFINSIRNKYNVNASQNNTFLFYKGEIRGSSYTKLPY